MIRAVTAICLGLKIRTLVLRLCRQSCRRRKTGDHRYRLAFFGRNVGQQPTYGADVVGKLDQDIGPSHGIEDSSAISVPSPGQIDRHRGDQARKRDLRMHADLVKAALEMRLHGRGGNSERLRGLWPG